MNERIKELADQVERIRDLYNIGPVHRDAVEHFAELIVQECFDAVINDGRFHDAKNIIRAAKVVAMEHFGVE